MATCKICKKKTLKKDGTLRWSGRKWAHLQCSNCWYGTIKATTRGRYRG